MLSWNVRGLARKAIQSFIETVVAEFDPLKDEGIAYAQKLLEAGNDSEILMCEGMLHDFCGMATSFESARAYFLQIISKIQAHLGN